MSRIAKFLIGLAAILLMAWLYHGPLGNGERLVAGLEMQARAAIAASELPGIDVGFSRDPLSRTALLSGQANEFQREGQGSLPGLNDLVGKIEGVAGVRWSDDPSAPDGVPLILETLTMTVIAYLLGLGLGWLLFGRRRKTSYLD